MNDELPSRRPNDPPIQGPHQIVGEPGITHHMVFAGPNTMPRTTAEPAPAPQRPILVRALRDFAGALAGLVAIITAGLLTLEYPQLTVASRLACGTITVLICAGFAVHWARRRREHSSG